MKFKSILGLMVPGFNLFDWIGSTGLALSPLLLHPVGVGSSESGGSSDALWCSQVVGLTLQSGYSPLNRIDRRHWPYTISFATYWILPGSRFCCFWAYIHTRCCRLCCPLTLGTGYKSAADGPTYIPAVVWHAEIVAADFAVRAHILKH